MPVDPGGGSSPNSGASIDKWRKNLRYGSGAVVRRTMREIDAWVDGSTGNVRRDRLKTAVDLGNFALRENTSTDKNRWRGDLATWKGNYAAERGRGSTPDHLGGGGPIGNPTPKQQPARAERPAAPSSPPSGGGPSSPGGGGPTPSPSGGTDPGGPLGARAIPGGNKLWKVGRTIYIVYRDPIRKIPLGYAVEDGEELEAIFGSDLPPLDRTFAKSADAERAGLVVAGRSRELRAIPNDRHPFDQITAEWEDQVAVQPWLRDPEMLAVVMEANLEGREPSQAEISNTNWWRTHNEAQRQWLSLTYGDPAEAQKRKRSAQLQVKRMLKEAGVLSAPGKIISFLGAQLSSGLWSQEQVAFQVGVIANPSSGTLSKRLAPLVEEAEQGQHFGRAVDDTDPMRQKVERWLGPLFARGYSDEWLRTWSRRIADEPAWEERFNDAMRAQFKALFPGYADIDDDLTYEDVAGPWKSMVQQKWGTGVVDESDPFFMDLVRLGASEDGSTKVSQRLLQEGLKRNNGKVWQDWAGQAMASQGQGVRGPIG